MRFRKLSNLLTVAAVLSWGLTVAAYALLVMGHTLTPAAPTATLALLICVTITSTMGAMACRLVPSAVAAWTLGYIEGREDSHEQSHGATLLRIVNPGDSYQSSSDPRAHFGLGEAARYDSIHVLWPDGLAEVFPGGDADRAVELARGKGTAEKRGPAR